MGGVVPTVKVSSHSDLAERKRSWIDFDAGELLKGVGMEELGERFFGYLLEVASGRVKTRNEERGYQEIAIFKDGVTL